MTIRWLLFVWMALALREVDAVACRGQYYHASRIQSQPMGFCWYFFNGNYTVAGAESHCARHSGHLPAINSDTKATKLANFTSAMRHLYRNGTFDRSWLPVYEGGWVGNIIWGDRINSDRSQRVWKVTGAPVSYQGFDDTTVKVEQGDSCTTFDLFTGKWRYSSCDGVNILLCEENGHEYPDEKPDEVERTYLAESCPYAFSLVSGRCLLLGRVSGMFAANLYCTHHGGHLAVVTAESDERALAKFIADHHYHKWSSFLSPIVYINNEFVWESTGQSADYVARKFNLIPNQAILYDTLIVINMDGNLEECFRHKCNARAFCQANDQDYYADVVDPSMYDY